MAEPRRIAYTLEQLWHRVPGGTAVAALETLDALLATSPEVEMIGVAGTHREPPAPPWAPPISVASLPGRGARLYTSWLWLGRPAVERATGRIDVVHATTIIPCPSQAPLVVTVHDLAFLHEPTHFTRWGRHVFARSLSIIRRRAEAVLCSSAVTADDCERAGIGRDRLRVVPLGVRPPSAPSAGALDSARAKFDLPDGFVLFVGTVEPRKNLVALAEAVRRSGLGLPLVAAGPDGWGADRVVDPSVRFLGFVTDDELAALYSLATVFAYPSRREGFGLPVLEAMAHGTPVVTSSGTATEEAAGGAAVLVDPRSVDDIARGLHEAVARRAELEILGRARAAASGWSATALATAAVYEEVAGR